MSVKDSIQKDKDNNLANAEAEQERFSDDLVNLSDEELKHVIAKHSIWLSTNKIDGKQAILKGRILTGNGLRGKDLRNAILSGLNFQGADLSGADLRGADLSDANFGDSIVNDVKFQGAVLKRANLQSVKNLLPTQLSATNLSGAVLPNTIATFEGIKQADRIVTLGRTPFFLMLATSIFVLVFIAKTNDVELIAGTAAETLPLLNIDLPIISFIHVVPVLVFALYLYLTLYLVALFEELSSLPAILPDGRTLDQHVEPWMMTSLIHSFMPHLENARHNFSGLREKGAFIIAWWVAPFIIALVWLYYIRARLFWSSAFHALIFVLAVTLGISTYYIGTRSLRGWNSSESSRVGNRILNRYFFVGIGATSALVLAVTFSYLAVNTPRLDSLLENKESGQIDTFKKSIITLRSLHAMVMLRSLDVSNSNVSAKPIDWQDPLDLELNENAAGSASAKPYWKSDELRKALESSGVESANLVERDLSGLVASSAFMAAANLLSAELHDANLVKADLRGADLKGVAAHGADFSYAKLMGAQMVAFDLRPDSNHSDVVEDPFERLITNTAKFSSANLTGADLSAAKLSGADMTGATLTYAILNSAILTKANLSGADLSNAQLSGTDFSHSILEMAVFDGAILSGAILTHTQKLTQAQLNQACGDTETRLPEGLTLKACIDPN